LSAREKVGREGDSLGEVGEKGSRYAIGTHLLAEPYVAHVEDGLEDIDVCDGLPFLVTQTNNVIGPNICIGLKS
jgi:hypothetical protein